MREPDKGTEEEEVEVEEEGTLSNSRMGCLSSSRVMEGITEECLRRRFEEGEEEEGGGGGRGVLSFCCFWSSCW